MTTTSSGPVLPQLTEEDRKALRRWSHALRTTTVPQCRDKLFDGPQQSPTGFCCLAVWCTTQRGEFMRDSPNQRSWINHQFGTKETEATLRLPSGQLLDTLPAALTGEFFSSLNDYQRLTFAQIADYIDYLVDHLPST